MGCANNYLLSQNIFIFFLQNITFNTINKWNHRGYYIFSLHKDRFCKITDANEESMREKLNIIKVKEEMNKLI